MIEDVLARGWENFIDRTSGPLSLRFVMQPAMAILMAIRAGIRDAHENKPAFFWAVLTKPGERRPLLREAFKDTSKVFAIAVVLDFVYQVSVQRGVYALELVFTAMILAFFPYLLFRGPVNRIVSRMNHFRKMEGIRSLGDTHQKI